MRVVIDTNVFISSFLGKGNPNSIIDLWKKGYLTICLSREIIDEYVDVLIRLGIINSREIEELLQLFAQGYHSTFIAKTKTIKIVMEDPDDNKFFECAVALNAKYIISGDKQVLKVKNYFGIKVVNPKIFLQDFEGNK